MLKKYLIEFAFMFVLLGAVIFARYLTYIDNSAVGSLLGAIIGYFAKDIRKINT